MPDYDYIIIGAGASGLLLANAMGSDPFFAFKSILVLDKSAKSENDRTWCFWEKGTTQFESVLHKSWPKIHFAGPTVTQHNAIAPYQYKMVRGIDFYVEFKNRLASFSNISQLHDEVVQVEKTGDYTIVHGKKTKYSAKIVFDSRFNYAQLLKQDRYPVLQQHFLGWFVRSENPVFNENEATFMDFSIPQNGNTRFMYVLPFSPNEALVEYTLFSKDVLPKNEYEDAIKSYLQDLGVTNYKILEVEQGNIPMSCYNFSKDNTDQYIKIGVAGGWAKASTGFTFYNSAKQVTLLAEHLKSRKSLSKFRRKNRFWFYDLIFLDVLAQNNQLGSHVFESLFKKRSPQLVLKFLDEDTTFWEDLKVMWACPKWLFFKTALKRFF